MLFQNEVETQRLGELIGKRLVGGELIELIGDVGAGKTTFTRGLARGLGVVDQIQSPTFTVNREYEARDGLKLVHYDFYRLSELGIMAEELQETLSSSDTIAVIEWAGIASDELPDNRIIVHFLPVADNEDSREIKIVCEEKTIKQKIDEVLHVLAA